MGSFALGIDKYINARVNDLSVIPRKIALDLYRGVILDTPVDTGRARGGWIPTVGEAPVAMGQGEGWFQGDMAQTFENYDKSGRKAVEATRTAVNEEWKPLTGESIFLTNSVPYIAMLNAGHSKQAPARFVEINVLRVGGRIAE